jgi:hypothetical protein
MNHPGYKEDWWPGETRMNHPDYREADGVQGAGWVRHATQRGRMNHPAYRKIGRLERSG